MRRVAAGWLVVAAVLAVAGPLQAGDDAPEPLVSVLFFETELREALSELVMLTGVNIIADETVHGIVTLDLQDVPLEKALHMLLLGGGYALRKIDDYYVVGLPDPRGPAFWHLAETEVVPLRYITAEESRHLLPALYDEFVRASPDGNRLTITAPRAIIERFNDDVRRIDRPRQMVTLQLVVTELAEDALRQLGSHSFWFAATDGHLRLGLEDGRVLGFANDALSILTGPGGDVLARLRALESVEQASIRANPRVTVADGETARLFVGERQVIMLQPHGTTTRLEEVDVGVVLEVTPRIVGADEIQVTVAPEVSHFLQDRGAPRDDRFIVRRSEVSTTIFLQNGRTAVIAGMALEEGADQVRKVPILGDIPLVGRLFRQSSTHRGERELLVLVTAEIRQP